MLERLEVVEEPRKEWELRMSIAGAPPSGRVVAVLNGTTVRRGNFTLGPVTLQIDRGDRVAITGANGSGKTTLLALLLGGLTPDSGSATLGSGVEVGEIDQVARRSSARRRCSMRSSPRCRSWRCPRPAPCWRSSGSVTTVDRAAASLSPGERTRAGLALLQARGVNLLVLDEPTNHLDLTAIEQLESRAQRVRRHGPARHPRPTTARERRDDPSARARRRCRPRRLRRSAIPAARRSTVANVVDVGGTS